MPTKKNLDIITEFQQHRDWFKKAYQVRFLPWTVQMWAVEQMMVKFPWSMQYGGTISGENGLQSWMWKESEMKRTREYFIDQTIQHPSFFDEFENGFMEQWEAYQRAEEEFMQVYSADSLDAMITHIRALIDAESRVGLYGYVNDAFLSSGGEDWIIQWIDTELPKDIPHRETIVAQLATPVEHSFVQQEELDRLRILLQPKTTWKTLFVEHTKRWNWIENSYIESAPLSVEFFYDKSTPFLQQEGAVENTIQRLTHAPEEKRQQKQRLYEQYDLSPTLQRVIDLSERFSHMTDLRKMGVLRLNGFLWQFLRDLSQHTGQPFDVLSWLHQSELEELISTQDWERLRERKEKGMLYLIYRGETVFVQGDEFRAIDTIPFFSVNRDAQVLRGQMAYKQTVEGPARVITGRNDFHLFQEGDILVTNQTTPEFLPLMKKAAGVVAEQGGITCHAAIVSREFQIPCIIGAQTAMQVFRNGERIRIDAEKGEVQRITRE